MTKLLLDATYIFNGTFYGPGEVDIEDEEAHKQLKGKIDAAAKAKADTPAPLTDVEASAQADARQAALLANRTPEAETAAGNRAAEKRR